MSLANVSSAIGSSSFPQPVAPDVVLCDKFWNYDTGPQVDECWKLWALLPQGTNEQTWYTQPTALTRNPLPLELGNGL